MRSVLEKKTFTSIVVFFGVVLLIVGAVIVPTVRYILELDRQANELRVLLEKKNERAIHFRAALKQIDKIKEGAPDFSIHFFSYGEELKLVTTLEKLAAQDNITQRIVSSNIDNITNQRVLFSVEISGPYEKVLTYLSDLEHLPYFINVVKLNFAPVSDRASKSPTDTIVALNLDLVLYVNKP